MGGFSQGFRADMGALGVPEYTETCFPVRASKVKFGKVACAPARPRGGCHGPCRGAVEGFIRKVLWFSVSSRHILEWRAAGAGVGPNSLPLACEPAGRFDRNSLQLAPSSDAPPVQLVC